MRWGRIGVFLGSTAAHVGAVVSLAVLGVGASSVVVLDLREAWLAETPPPREIAPPPPPAEPPPPRSVPRRVAVVPEPPAPTPTPPAVVPIPPPPREAPAPVSPPAPPPVPATPVAPPPPEPAPVVKPETRPAPPAAVEARPVPPAASPGPRSESSQASADGPALRAPRDNAAEATQSPRGGPASPSGAITPQAGSSAPARGQQALAIPGDGTSKAPAEYGAYYAGFRKRVQEALVYPLSARRRGLMGSLEVEVLIDANGAVSSAHVVASSSHAVLDEAALNAVRSLAPQPLPGHLPRQPLRIRLPLTFVLQ